MPSLTDDMMHVQVVITPPADRLAPMRTMVARFAYDRLTLESLRIPPTPSPTDYLAIDAYTAAIRRHRGLVEAIGGTIAHQIVQALTQQEAASEAAA